MNSQNITYTDVQRNFIRKMLQKIPEVEEHWYNHTETWGKHGSSFYADLNSFVKLVEDSILNSKDSISLKVLNEVEKFLKYADEESKDAIVYFFFEDLINYLEHEEAKYIRNFISLLGPYSKECCRKLDNFWKTKTEGLWNDDKNRTDK